MWGNPNLEDGEPKVPKLHGWLWRTPVFWRFQILGWGAFAAYAYLTRLSFWQDHTVALLLTVILEPFAMLLSTGLRYLYLTLGLRREKVGKVMAVIVTASGVAAAVQLSVAHGAYLLLSEWGFQGTGTSRFGARIVFFWLIFTAWSFVYLWLKAEVAAKAENDRRKAAESAAQQSELEMLRLQLNPHFLFNSLNNIASEIPEQPEIAVEMTRQMADYLRYSLERQGEIIVPLGSEIEAVKNYLAIEKSRFEDRLQVSIEQNREAAGKLVPCFLLQPLVENAMKHGLTTSAPPWHLGIAVRGDAGRLHIRVSNSGVLSEDWENRRRHGTGVINLTRRLALHYPGRHRFELKQEVGKVVADLNLEGEACKV